MTTSELLSEIKSRLARVHGQRLRGVVLRKKGDSFRTLRKKIYVSGKVFIDKTRS